MSRNKFWRSSTLLFFLLPIHVHLLKYECSTIYAQTPSWHIIYQGNRYFHFSKMDFIDEQNGWIGGRVFDSTPPNAIKSLVFKTTDAGNTWEEQQFDSLTNSAIGIEDVKFLNSFTGILTSSKCVYFTRDGGDSWTKHVFQNDSLIYYTAYLLNDSTWIIGGGEVWGSWGSISPGGGDNTVNVIKKTTDFGNTWSEVFIDTLSPIYSMDFINDSCGIAIAGNRVLFTNNYGGDWKYINHSQNLSYFSEVQSVDDKIFALAKESNSQDEVLLISSDNGYNWDTRYVFNSHPAIFCMYFADSLFGRVGGITSGRDILLTTDGGYTWISEATPINWSIHSIYTTRNIGFAGSHEGYIQKYGIPTQINQKENEAVLNQSVKIYPNPGNEIFTISIFSNPQSTINAEIYDILGNRIIHLIKDKKVIGKFDAVWNSKNENRRQVASGVYFLILKTDKRVLTKKILLIR